MTYQPPPGQPEGQPQGQGGQQPPRPPAPPGPPQGQPQSQPQSQWAPPTPAPYGGGGSPSGSFDPKSVNPLDWGILGAGVLIFIFSFVSYYTASVHFGGVSESVSENAWHGFFGWFAVLCALVGSGVVAVALFLPQQKLPAPARLVCLGAYGLATLCLIIQAFFVPGVSGDVSSAGVDVGHGFGFWISLLLVLAGLALAYLRFTQTGGTLPVGGGSGSGGIGGALGNLGNFGKKDPPAQSGPPAGYQQPPPGGYSPQPPPPSGGYTPPPPPGGYSPPPPPPSGGYAPPPPPPSGGYTPPPGYSPPPPRPDDSPRPS